MRTPRRGEVWWLVGRETARRPALVMTRDAVIPLLNRVIVVPATRTIRNIPTEVFLDAEDGMPAECVLSLDNLTVVPRSSLRSRITTLAPARMSEVCTALNTAVACS